VVPEPQVSVVPAPSVPSVGGAGRRVSLSLCCRTKWKRQNQLRLEQLRQQARAEQPGCPEGGSACCPQPYQPPCSFLSTAAAIFRNVTYGHGCQL
jgi:hypothetical protein